MIIKSPACYDVSHWDGAINWASVSPRPLLVICKATEGTFYVDNTFAPNMAGLAANGIKRGVYHFHRKLNDPILQAKLFCNTVRGIITPDDYIVLDVEEGGEDAADLKAWFTFVRAQFPNPFILYSRKNILDPIGMTLEQAVYFKQIPVWTAGYPLNPDTVNAPLPDYIPVQTKFGPVRMWQYTQKGRVTGINASVDINWLAPEFVKELGGVPIAPLDIMTTPHDGIMRVSGTRYGWRFELFKIDPLKVHYEVSTTTPALETVSAATKRTGATLGINGSDWDRIGTVISPIGRPSLVITSTDNVLISDKPQTNVKGLVTGLRFIVVGGTLPVYLFGTEAQYTERHARSIHGLTATGQHLILQSTGTYPNQGLTLRQAAEIMVQYGAVTAFDSGGGGDVTCILDGQSLIVPENINTATGAHFERPLPQTLLIYTRGLTMPNGTAKNISGSASAVRVKPSRYAADSGKPRPVNGAVIEFVKIADAVVTGPLDLATDKWLQLPDGNFVNHILNGVPFYTVLTQPTPDPVTPPVTVKPVSVTYELAAGSVITTVKSDGSVEKVTV